MIVEEGKRKEIEAKLRQMIALQNQSQQERAGSRPYPESVNTSKTPVEKEGTQAIDSHEILACPS
jgi:hypothetical protein